MMATFTLFAHWLACGFYALASYERRSLGLDDGVGYLNELAQLTGMEYTDNATTAGGPDIRSRYITSLYLRSLYFQLLYFRSHYITSLYFQSHYFRSRYITSLYLR